MTSVPRSAAHIHKNEVHLAGVLARDPEVKYTQSGKAVANVSIATTYEKHTEYHRVVFWEEKAEKIGEHFHKGDYIKLCGRLQTRNYEKDGRKVYITEIVAWNFSDGTTEESEPPITPDPNRKSGTAVARAILSPAKGITDADTPF